MFQFATAITVATAAALLLAPHVVDAHGGMMVPAPRYTSQAKDKQWAPIAYMEGQYPVGPDLLGFIKSKGAKTLRDFMDNKSLYRTVNDPDVNFECGWTNLKGPRQPIPANGMVRSNGYTHDGPCEIWLDNTRVLHGDNCHSEIAGDRPFYKIDWSACKQDCVLRWYWFGNRHVNGGYSWQVYKNCIPIKGSGGAGVKSTMNATSDGTGKDADTAVPVSTSPAIATSAPRKCKVKHN